MGIQNQSPVRGKNYMHQQAVTKIWKKRFHEIRTVKREEYHLSTLCNIAMMIQIYISIKKSITQSK